MTQLTHNEKEIVFTILSDISECMNEIEEGTFAGVVNFHMTTEQYESLTIAAKKLSL